MLVGIAGCGKTQLMKGLLGRQNEAERISLTINMNFFTTTNLLQSGMETVLVKKTGTSFGPPGKADLIYFVCVLMYYFLLFSIYYLLVNYVLFTY